MQKTENYNLCQWETTDSFRREDFNESNRAIDAALAAKAEKSALTAVETALANYKSSNDTALAKKADASALTAYQTSNDAAVASVAAKANAAYSPSNPQTASSAVVVDTTGMTAGSTVYTFTTAPKAVLLRGEYDGTLVVSGKTANMYDGTTISSLYTVTFQLSGKKLILKARSNESSATSLISIALY